MQQITLNTQSIALPQGKIAGNWRIGLLGTSFDYRGPDPFVTFSDVAAGLYTIYAERLATDETRIGGQITREVEVTGEMVDVPVAILVGGV